HQRLPRAALGDVVLDGGAGDVGCDGLRARQVAVGDDDVRALARKPAGGGGADARRAAGDDRDPVGEAVHHASAGRQVIITASVPDCTTSSRWLTTSTVVMRTPMPGRERDGRVSTTFVTVWIVSPGYVGPVNFRV